MIGYTVKIWLVSCLVVACNSGRVSFESKETTKETTIEGADNNAGEITQQVKPIITGRPLDILLVIDSSGSMKKVHDTLSKHLEPLLKKVKNSDWRIVITTATFTDCLRAEIDKDDENYEETFIAAINGLIVTEEQRQQGQEKENESYVSDWEDTVRMATKALPTKDGSKLQYNLPLRTTETFTAPQQLIYHDPNDVLEVLKDRPTWCTADVNHKNAGEDTPRAHWLRDESMLAILLITDEDAFSGDSWPPNSSPSPAEAKGHPNCGCDEGDLKGSCQCLNKFWRRLTEIRNPRVTAKVYGLLNTLDESHSKFYLGWRSKSEEDENEEKLFDSYSSIYKNDENDKREVADFESILNSISTDVAQQMHKTYPLDRFPDGGTLKVIFAYDDDSTKEQPASSYRIEGRNLIFNESPPLEVKAIKVTFSFKQ